MPKKEKTIQICRSFSQKVANPSNRFENTDFFASATAEVGEKDKEKISEVLYIFVQDEVAKSVYAYKLENLPLPETTKLQPKDFAIAKGLAQESEAITEKAEELRQEEKASEENIAIDNLPTIEENL